jgi:hypothetical protein
MMMKVLYKHLANLMKLALLSLSLLLIPIQSHARDISLVWTAVPEPLSGYKLYVQNGSNAVGAPITLGKVTSHTLTGLSPEKTYHFFLTAYNPAGESESSEIVTVAPSSSLAPTIINISIR